MTSEMIGWERAVLCLERRAASMTPSDEGRALLDCAVEYDRLIAETPATCLADLQVKVRRLAHYHCPPGARPPTPYTEPLLRTILAGIDRLGNGELADVRAGQVELAHSLANIKMTINVIAEGVTALLREREQKP